MRYILALLPITVVLVLMIRLRWGAHQAGAAGLAVGALVAALGFGLTSQVFWVSQAKGLLLSVFVLAVMWPALLLYHWIDQNHGVSATARLLEEAVPERGMCLLLLAWALSGLLEGIAGFGLPIAVVAPMLVALGVPAVRAVAAVAVGHSWAVTFGDMGVILQTLSAVVSVPVGDLVPCAGILLGFVCLVCGLLAALILGELRRWPQIAVLSVIMGTVQFGLAAAGLVPLSAFGAGLSGWLAYLLGTRIPLPKWRRRPEASGTDERRARIHDTDPAASLASRAPTVQQRDGPNGESEGEFSPKKISRLEPPSESLLHGSHPALLAISCYGVLTVLMAALTMISPVHKALQGVAWKPQFSGVSTSAGFTTAAGPGQIFRPLMHPGTLILLVACASMSVACLCRGALPTAKRAVIATGRSAGTASLGIVFMVGMSTLMDHCGMSNLLAQGLSTCLGSAYPLVSPGVGILGAFATGSNNTSNVLFGPLQKSVAILQNIQPPVLIAAQTAGGSLGSMLAPAKIIVGCSTVGEVGREGQVLRKTVPLGLGAGIALGVLTFLLARLH